MDDEIMTDACQSQAAAECLLQLSLRSTVSPSSPEHTVDEEHTPPCTSPKSLAFTLVSTPSTAPVAPISSDSVPIVDERTTLLADGTWEFPCMYDDDCDTDAPRRKCISHIFGRNKTCTRKIPKGMWLYHCRKHYQRARYRADGEWAREQSKVIRRQFDRLKKWDEITGWNIQPVKKEREAIVARVLGGKAPSSSPERKKRKAPAITKTDSGADGSLTGTWAWLRFEFGAMDSDDVYNLLVEIDRLLHENDGLKYPRIEILANFPAASKKPKKSSPKNKKAKDAVPSPQTPKRRSNRRIIKKTTQRVSRPFKPAQNCRSTRSNPMDIDHVLN